MPCSTLCAHFCSVLRDERSALSCRDRPRPRRRRPRNRAARRRPRITRCACCALAAGDALTLFTGARRRIRGDARARRQARRVGAARRVLCRSSASRRWRSRWCRASPRTTRWISSCASAVELGAAALQPVVAARGARFPAGERGDKRLAHWRQIAVAACEQCGRNRVPPVHDVADLDAWLAARGAGARRASCSTRRRASASPRLPAPASSIDVLDRSRRRLHRRRGRRARRAPASPPVRMGPRILRTETASLAALAAINALWGDFR